MHQYNSYLWQENHKKILKLHCPSHSSGQNIHQQTDCLAYPQPLQENRIKKGRNLSQPPEI